MDGCCPKLSPVNAYHRDSKDTQIGFYRWLKGVISDYYVEVTLNNMRVDRYEYITVWMMFRTIILIILTLQIS
jgi:hypothetical protein